MTDTGYVECDDLSIAYRSSGDGPLNILVVPGIFSHVELNHEFPQYSDFISRLSDFAKVVEFDKRGQGLSDRISEVPTFEERANDISALVQALDLTNCVLFGLSEGAAMALLYAASHVEQISKVVTFGGYAKSCGDFDYALMPTHDERAAVIELALEQWGSGSNLGIFVPALGSSEAAKKLFGKVQKSSCSPSAMRKYFELNLKIDIRQVLPVIQQPVLALHHSDDKQVPISNSQYIAEMTPNARFEDCGPGGHYFWGDNNELVVSKIRSFLFEEMSGAINYERTLATILFVDIVGSTEGVQNLGDRQWRSILDQLERTASDLIELFRGRLVKFTGDGLLAIFDAPGRAVEFAMSLREKMSALGVEMRAGLHSGEIEIRGDDIGGLAVHAASRIESCAVPQQILVSRTVTDLTIGNTAFRFDDAGKHSLKGFSEKWDLFEVVSNVSANGTV